MTGTLALTAPSGTRLQVPIVRPREVGEGPNLYRDDLAHCDLAPWTAPDAPGLSPVPRRSEGPW